MFHNGIKLSSIVMALCIGSCNTGTLFPVSDVPCFQPTAWSLEGGATLVRTIPDVGDGILITFQTSAQIQEDFGDGDGILTFFPHDPVYRFSPDTGIIGLVDNSEWDNLTTPIRDCSLSLGNFSPFGFGGGPRPSLRFEEDEKIPIAGGALVTFDGAPSSAVIAVESTDGSFCPPIPFTPGTTTGQHFHQLFSRLDGSPVGEAVRLGVGRANQCWTLDEKYVIYGGLNANEERTRCIVPIEDNLPQFGN